MSQPLRWEFLHHPSSDASDGDLFTYRFKKHKLGKVIGKRTWGGVVGIRGSLPLLDGGSLNKPEFSRYDVAGRNWIIESYGVEPDIYVDNDPAKEYAKIRQVVRHVLDADFFFMMICIANFNGLLCARRDVKS